MKRERPNGAPFSVGHIILAFLLFLQVTVYVVINIS